MANPVSVIEQFSVTTPAGTAIASPQTTPMQLGPSDVQWIEITVPSGPNGNVGFFVSSSGQQIIPANLTAAATWIVADNYTFHYDIQGYQTTGDWSLVTYNTGANPHTLQVRFGYTPPAAAADTSSGPQGPSLAILNG